MNGNVLFDIQGLKKNFGEVDQILLVGGKLAHAFLVEHIAVRKECGRVFQAKAVKHSQQLIRIRQSLPQFPFVDGGRRDRDPPFLQQ